MSRRHECRQASALSRTRGGGELASRWLISSWNQQPRYLAAQSIDVLWHAGIDRTLVSRETAGAVPLDIPEALWNKTGLVPATDRMRSMRPTKDAWCLLWTTDAPLVLVKFRRLPTANYASQSRTRQFAKKGGPTRVRCSSQTIR